MIDKETGRKIKGKVVSLVLDEISAVDRPAQEHARMVIMKRAGDGPGEPTKESDMTFKSLDEAIAHIKKQDEEVATSKAALEAAQKAKDDAEKERDDMKAKADKALAEAAEARKAVDVAKADETIKVGDQEIRKSAVGESVFAAMKAQEARNAETEKRLATERAEKRAEGPDFSRLPGTAAEKGAALMAIDGIADEAARNAVVKMLKSGNAAMATEFRIVGKGGTAIVETDAEKRLEQMAKDAHAKDASKSFEQHYDEVARTAEGRKLYAEVVNKSAEVRGAEVA